MRLFSNFDTRLRRTKFKEYQDKYGPENVIVFGRSKLYWVLKVFFPSLGLFLVTSVLVIFLYQMLGVAYFGYGLVAILLVDAVLVVPIIGKYIDYKLDFIIVTPDYLIMYDQTGVLDKNVVTVAEKSIKTISVKRHGLLYSIFDNGDVIFLSEGDTTNGEITLKRVARPEKRRADIARIMMKDVKREVIVEHNNL